MDFPINYLVVLVLSILGIGFVSVCLKRIDRLHVGFKMGVIAVLALVGIFGLVTLYLDLTTPNQTGEVERTDKSSVRSVELGMIGKFPMIRSHAIDI